MRVASFEHWKKESPRCDEVGKRRLTPREEEVLRLISLGNSYKEMATALAIGERTVQFHVGNMLRKFGVTTRLELQALLSRPAEAR